eukprot:7035699-Lingulodinium_polyedra.AAC.1
MIASLVPQGRRSVWLGGVEVVARVLQPLAAELATRGSVAERVGWTSDVSFKLRAWCFLAPIVIGGPDLARL